MNLFSNWLCQCELTSSKTCCSTNREARPSRYLFLFSLKQLSNCKNKTRPNFSLLASNVFKITFIVKLESCGTCFTSVYIYGIFPCALSVCSRTPAMKLKMWFLERFLHTCQHWILKKWTQRKRVELPQILVRVYYRGCLSPYAIYRFLHFKKQIVIILIRYLKHKFLDIDEPDSLRFFSFSLIFCPFLVNQKNRLVCFFDTWKSRK